MEIFLKGIKGKQRGKDCFRPCGRGLKLNLPRFALILKLAIVLRSGNIITIGGQK